MGVFKTQSHESRIGCFHAVFLLHVGSLGFAWKRWLGKMTNTIPSKCWWTMVIFIPWDRIESVKKSPFSLNKSNIQWCFCWWDFPWFHGFSSIKKSPFSLKRSQKKPKLLEGRPIKVHLKITGLWEFKRPTGGWRSWEGSQRIPRNQPSETGTLWTKRWDW